MEMLASTAVRLPKEVVNTLVEIMNTEEPDLLFLTKEGNGNNSALENDCSVNL